MPLQRPGKQRQRLQPSREAAHALDMLSFFFLCVSLSPSLYFCFDDTLREGQTIVVSGWHMCQVMFGRPRMSSSVLGCSAQQELAKMLLEKLIPQSNNLANMQR